MSNQKVGKWTVLSKHGNTKNGAAIWKAICECGNIGFPLGSDLRANKSTSCGCLQKSAARKTLLTHGESKTRLYRIYKAIKTRCTNKNISNSKYYSEKNIKMCNEWNDFLVFKKWAYENGYKESLTIDRIDNNKGYSPENCRWATKLEQSINRSFVLKSPSGEPWSQIAKRNGIPVTLFHSRKHEGWTCEQAATLPKGTRIKNLRQEAVDG